MTKPSGFSVTSPQLSLHPAVELWPRSVHATSCVHVHTHVHADTCGRSHAHMCTCTCARIHCTHIHMQSHGAHAHTHTCTRVHSRVHTCASVYIWVRMYTCTHTYAHFDLWQGGHLNGGPQPWEHGMGLDLQTADPRMGVRAFHGQRGLSRPELEAGGREVDARLPR